jgi:hypothetical protein
LVDLLDEILRSLPDLLLSLGPEVKVEVNCVPDPEYDSKALADLEATKQG